MTTSEVIILGLLYENDLYGYEIEDSINRKGLREWTDIGFSSIYNILNKLEKSALISSKYEKEFGSPKRKVYHISDDTKVLFINEVKRMLSCPKRTFNEFDIGIFNSKLLSEDELIYCMVEYQKYLEIRLEDLQEKMKRIPAVQKYDNAKALFTRPICLTKAEIEWITEQFK